MILLVVYDLRRPERDLPVIRDLLESASDDHFQLQETVWLLDSLHQPKWWRAELGQRGDGGDPILIVRLVRRWAALQMDAGSTWLTDPVRRW